MKFDIIAVSEIWAEPNIIDDLNLIDYSAYHVTRETCKTANPTDYMSRNPITMAGTRRYQKMAEDYVNFIAPSSIPHAMKIEDVKRATDADEGVDNSPLSRSFPASVTRLLAAVFMFCPDMTSSAMCTPVFNARFPNATAPRLMSGMARRSRPPNTLPSPCPRFTRAPTK